MRMKPPMPGSASISENNRRIARNTILLYFRMLVMTVIALLTSRVVLNALGTEDYGVYNAVGGAVMLFTFLTTSISSSIGRFMAVEIESGDAVRMHRVFSVGVFVQTVFAAVLVLLAETLGMWFLTDRMMIPDGRMEAARIVLHCSLATLVVDLFAVPFNAAIIAHERMSAFALISVADAVLKLAVALAITLSPADKLCSYAVLMLLRSVGVRALYGVYCRRHFAECRGRLEWDGKLFRQIAGFSTWSTIGASAGVFNTQGVNLIVNVFFGVAVNAARGVASQVEGLARMFVSNFLVALNPRITKSWSAGEKDYCFELVRKGMKFAFLGIFVFFIPLFLETGTLLSLWLRVVPAFSADFVRLTLVALLVDLSCNSALTLILAEGRIRNYYIASGAVSYLCLPLVWLAFRMGASPAWAYVCFIAVYLVVNVIRLFVVRAQTGFSLRVLARKVVLPLLAVSALSLGCAAAVHLSLPEGLVRTLLVCVCGWAVLSVGSYFLVLTDGERSFVRRKLMLRPRGGTLRTDGEAVVRTCAPHEGKIVIYTCITGGYDTLRQPAVTDPSVDFVCFVGKGERKCEAEGVWQFRELDCGIEDPRLLSRYPKMHPHLLLPEYDASLWIDGNIEITDGSVYDVLRRKAESGVLYSGVRHPSRDCVYSEAWMCFKMGYLDIPGYLRVCAFLLLHGQRRHGGLVENNLIFRRHNDPRVIRLDELWWSMLFRLSRRDQLSFPWCLEKCGIPFNPLLPDGMNTRNYPGFRYLLHK